MTEGHGSAPASTHLTETMANPQGHIQPSQKLPEMLELYKQRLTNPTPSFHEWGNDGLDRNHDLLEVMFLF